MNLGVSERKYVRVENRVLPLPVPGGSEPRSYGPITKAAWQNVPHEWSPW